MNSYPRRSQKQAYFTFSANRWQGLMTMRLLQRPRDCLIAWWGKSRVGCNVSKINASQADHGKAKFTIALF
jgi:hypothetical protein